ncbi:CPBP family intramembrane metalloprotease [Paenibacillaceae bacterium]|nr:CPBP family intramembrane metalloprotease [Paenibacillaceae bacterium]
MQHYNMHIGQQNNQLKWWITVPSGWGVFVLALFLATSLGTIVHLKGASELMRQCIQASIVSLITVPSLYFLLKHTTSRPFRSIGLSRWRQSIPKAISGAALVIVLSGAGFILAHLLGWIKITQFHFSLPLVMALFLNMIIAFFYEAFPEELTFRGTVYHALKGQFNKIVALILQPILFVLAPVAVSGLQYLTGQESLPITLDYIILLLSFGFILQLLRIVTGSLWTSIAFHVAFLENSRFFVLQRETRFITYEEIIPGTGELFIIFFMTLIVGILILIVAAMVRRNTIRWHRFGGDNHV